MQFRQPLCQPPPVVVARVQGFYRPEILFEALQFPVGGVPQLRHNGKVLGREGNKLRVFEQGLGPGGQLSSRGGGCVAQGEESLYSLRDGGLARLVGRSCRFPVRCSEGGSLLQT